MANALVPCGGCGRHVRSSETACPFCGATVNEDARAKAIPAANTRMTRNAMFVFATTLALSGCAASTGPSDSGTGGDVQSTDSGVPQDSGVADSGNPVAMYGAPQPTDSGVTQDSGVVTDTGIQDGGGNVALYGSPAPVDAGQDSAMNDDGGGGVGPLYGGPTPTDGGPGLRYGAPPPSFDA
ncbi:MAG: hypothetical protein JNK05_32660 [Myxococcales bacterium]|nr:hypothetical protein [Myxococcales bacterium]